MKRWQAAQFGEVGDVLRLEDVERPEPGPGEARVRVLAASLALPDLMMVRGEYPFLPVPPASPGQEVVGIVDVIAAGRIEPSMPASIDGPARDTNGWLTSSGPWAC
jgi:NADPH2:quinone reductase